MWAATLKGLLAYKLRLMLTAAAVILGVSFVTGTFVLTDTLTSFFDGVFKEANAGTDVVITPPTQGSGRNGGAPTERLPADLLAKTSAVAGVKFAEGQVQGFGQMLDHDGKPIGGQGPPTLAFSFGTHKEFTPLSIRAGHPPSGPDEVAIDVVTARKFNFKPGDRIKIIPEGPVREFTVAALVGFGKADNLGGATLVSWDLPTAQDVLSRKGEFDAINVKATSGTSVNTLQERLTDALPKAVQVRSGQQAAADSAAGIKQGIQFFGTAVLFFAGIAIFVGAFIIANTFSIIVAQRSRELALLRSLGASRSQVMGSVLAEAAIVGILASIVGIILGLFVGAGLRALVNSLGGGGGLPGASIGLRPRTIVVGLLVGTVTTVLSAFVPAIRGSRQPPVVALHNAVLPPPAHFSTRRLATGLAAALLGALLCARGLYGKDVPVRFGVVGFGLLLAFLGLAFLSPLAARPLAHLLGSPIARAYGITGRLARENAARNPQRTASTAAALMIGLAMVAAVATMGASMKASINRLLGQSIKAEVIINNGRGDAGIDPAVEARVAGVRGVATVVPLRFNQFGFKAKKRTVAAIRPDGLDKVLDFDIRKGSLAALRDGGVLVHQDIATKFGLRVGDSLPMEFPRGVVNVPIDGIYRNRQVIDVSYLLSLKDYEANYTDQRDAVVFVATAKSANAPTVAANIKKAISADYPQLQIQDQSEFKKRQSAQINQLLSLVGALLMLSVIIAILGIANTLALSVFERTRELGLLRAVGMGRRQVRRMIRWESVIIAVLGSVLGMVIGLTLGWAVVHALAKQGITDFVVPGGTLVTLVIMAAIAGMGAAIFPARRASRLNVLEAIATE